MRFKFLGFWIGVIAGCGTLVVMQNIYLYRVNWKKEAEKVIFAVFYSLRLKFIIFYELNSKAMKRSEIEKKISDETHTINNNSASTIELYEKNEMIKIKVESPNNKFLFLKRILVVFIIFAIFSTCVYTRSLGKIPNRDNSSFIIKNFTNNETHKF